MMMRCTLTICSLPWLLTGLCFHPEKIDGWMAMSLSLPYDFVVQTEIEEECPLAADLQPRGLVVLCSLWSLRSKLTQTTISFFRTSQSRRDVSHLETTLSGGSRKSRSRVGVGDVSQIA